MFEVQFKDNIINQIIKPPKIKENKVKFKCNLFAFRKELWIFDLFDKFINLFRIICELRNKRIE